MVGQQTHLCVIGHIHLVIRVGEAHPSWGLDIQHVGNLGGGGMSRRGVPIPSSTQTTLRDPQLQVYQVPRIGVVLQGDTIWLDLERKDTVL